MRISEDQDCWQEIPGQTSDQDERWRKCVMTPLMQKRCDQYMIAA